MYDFFSSPISQASMVACVEEDNVFLASAFKGIPMAKPQEAMMFGMIG